MGVYSVKRKMLSKAELIKAVDDAKTIADLFQLVKTQDIINSSKFPTI